MQNNSRNKASKCGRGGTGVKNQRAIAGVFDDIRSQEKRGEKSELADNIHVGRVIQKPGDGRVKVQYAFKSEVFKDKDGSVIKDGDEYELQDVIARIPGKFRQRREKRANWIDVNSLVLIEDSGLGIVEIKALLTRDQLKDLSNKIFIHPIFKSDQNNSGEGGGVEFAEESEEEKEMLDKDIDNI